MQQLKKVLIHTRDVFKNPVVAISMGMGTGLGAVLVILADTWFDVSTTDFVSAMANVFIACIAFVALLAARDYVGQMTTQEGYKKALEFNNSSFVKFKELIGNTPRFDYARGFAIGIRNSGENVNSKGLKIINDSISSMHERLGDINKSLVSLEFDLKTIRTYGLILSKDKQQSFDLIVSSCNSLSESIRNLNYLIGITNNFYNFKIDNYVEGSVLQCKGYQGLLTIIFNDNVDTVINELNCADDSIKKIDSAMKCYDSGSVNIKNYFIKDTD